MDEQIAVATLLLSTTVDVEDVRNAARRPTTRAGRKHQKGGAHVS